MRARTAVVLPLALCAALPIAPLCAQTGAITIYRCVDPVTGAVALQNDTPCPKGQQQTVRKLDPPPAYRAPPAPPPAAVPAHAPRAVADKAPPPPSPPSVRLPPPPLFQCRTPDDRDYLGDRGDPPASCVPMATVGIDGTSTLGAGQACEMQRDECTEVPAEQLCVAWKKRVDEAEFRWKFAGGRDDDRKAEYERLGRIYRDSTCGG